MKRKISLYLRDILQHMADAESFVEGMTLKRFERDKKTLYAVLRAIEVIGEATKRIPDDIRRRYPQIPWRQMAGMRDKVIHDYLSVDVETVWITVKERIPQLRPLLERICDELEEEEL